MWALWALLGALGCAILGVAALMGLLLLPSYVVLPPLWRADYATAERRARKLLWLPAGDLLLAVVLLQADQLDEADALLKNLMETVDMGGHARCYLLQFRGDHHDSEQLALHVLTREHATPTMRLVLIQAQLLQGKPTHTQVESIDKLLEEPENFLDRLTQADARAEMLSLRGWALALLGDEAAARADLDAAVDAIPENHLVGKAHTHWRVGLALRQLGDEAGATEHLRIAADADPGAQGRLAREALAA